MITISFIELAGFRGFRHKTRFDIPRGFAVFSGRNGAGKSTAFDAIDFALTGSINKFGVTGAKGGGLNDHLWWIGEGFAPENYVTVGFRDDLGNSWEIRREKDGAVREHLPSDLVSKLFDRGDVPDDWAQMLIKTSLIRDELISALSLDLSEQARFTAVRAALGSLEPATELNKLKALVRLAEQQREDQVTQHSRAHEDLGRALTAVTEARSAIQRQEDVSRAENAFASEVGQSEWSAAKSRIDLARSTVAGRRAQLSRINSALADARSLDGRRSRLEADSSQQRLNQLNEELSRTVGLVEELTVRSVQLDRDLLAAEKDDAIASAYALLLQSGETIGIGSGACPLCLSEVSNAEFNAAIETGRRALEGRSSSAAGLLLQVDENAKALAEAKRSARFLAGQRDSIAVERSEVEREGKALQTVFSELALGTVSDIRFAEGLASRYQEQTATLDGLLVALESSSVQDRLSTLNSRTDERRQLVEEEALRLAKAERVLERSKQIERSARVVSNELLAEQLDTVLPLLKELYLRLRPHAEWREIEIDVAGQVRASLNFSVGGGKNPQFLFSSGQRRAAGLAFLLAIYLSRPWCGLKSLMLDDPVQHVDDYRALNLVEVLASVRAGREQVIVAVEDDALADLLCRRLRINNVESGVRFNLAVDLTGSSFIEEQKPVAILTPSVFGMAEAS